MICKLCKKDTTKLCNSHIIPEFFYKPIYDEPHRYSVLSTDIDEKNRYKQKGIKEYLLCEKCEIMINRYEKYVQLDFYNIIKQNVKVDDKLVILTNLKYEALKLFQLSVLWRASISSHDMFQNVNLGSHQEKIRLMLYKENPGRFYEYGCILNILFRDELYCYELILSVEKRETNGQRIFIFVFGGLVWTYIISNNTNKFKHREFFLQEDGSLKMVKLDIRQIGFIMKLNEDLFCQDKL